MVSTARRCRLGFSRLWSALTNGTSETSWRVDLRQCDVHRLMVSFWSCVGYIGLGAALVIFGPTILDLGNALDISVGILSIMLGCRAVGAAFGSVGSGLAIDKLVNHSYILMSCIFLFSIATTVVVPLSVNVYMLAVFMFLNGMATGGLDSGTHAVLMRLWKEKSGPCMQLLHFSYGFGAFIAPLIAKQFISAELEQNEGNSTTNQSGSGWSGSGDCAVVGCNGNATEDGDFRIAYWISSSIFIPTLLAYCFYAVRYDVMRHFTKKKTMDTSGNVILNERFEEDEQEEDEPNEIDETIEFPRLAFREDSRDSSEKDDAAITSKDPNTDRSKKKKQPLYFVVAILLLLGIFMFFYVGLEIAYGSWIFTVAVTGPLDLSKSQGTVLQSLFWGMFAFTRLFSVVLAVLNVKASVMMTGNLTGSVIAAAIMVTFPHNAAAIWLASAVLGMSYASIYPTTMTWMSETIEATGKATSVLVTGGVLGDIIIPALMGALIAKVSPDALFYATFIGILICAVFVVLLFLLAYFQKRRERREETVSSPRTNGVCELSEEEVQLIDSEQVVSVADHEDATSL